MARSTTTTKTGGTAPAPALHPLSAQRRPGARSLAHREPVGRYDRERDNTWHPADGLGRMPDSQNRDETTAAVPDPYRVKDERILATVNRRVDVLEYERSRGLISEGAYGTGRLVQSVFEHVGRVGGTNWCGTDRIDPALANNLKMQRAIDGARTIGEFEARMRGHLGTIDTKLLRLILGERKTFTECAFLQGKTGDRGERYIAARYRDALETLTEAWTAKGKVQPTPDDRHRAAAGAAVPRQDGAIVGGATLRRLEAELAGLEGVRGRKDEAEALKTQIAQLRLSQGLARAREVRR